MLTVAVVGMMLRVRRRLRVFRTKLLLMLVMRVYVQIESWIERERW